MRELIDNSDNEAFETTHTAAGGIGSDPDANCFIVRKSSCHRLVTKRNPSKCGGFGAFGRVVGDLMLFLVANRNHAVTKGNGDRGRGGEYTI